MTFDDYSPIVAEAAAWLDAHWPAEQLGQWWDLIEWGKLDMDSTCQCVAGQLGAAIAAYEGFGTIWHKGLAETRIRLANNQSTDGYGLLACKGYEYHSKSVVPDRVYDSEVDLSWRDLYERTTKRLSVDLEETKERGQIIPLSLDMAFAPIPRRFWKAEADKRRLARWSSLDG